MAFGLFNITVTNKKDDCISIPNNWVSITKTSKKGVLGCVKKLKTTQKYILNTNTLLTTKCSLGD